VLHRVLRCLAGAVLLVAGPTAVNPAAAHGINLKVQHALPADSTFHTQFLVPWTQKVEKESGGRLHFHLYPAMQMGGEPLRLFDQVKSGDAEIVWAGTDSAGAHFASLEPFELPFMTSSTQGSSRALWEYVRMSDAAHMELDGIRVLAIHQSDAPQFHLRDRQIKSRSDLSGLKIGVPSRIGTKLLAELGADAVEMSPAQAGGALSSRDVDGVLLPWEVVATLKIDGSVKHHSEMDPQTARLYASVNVFAMNAAAFKSLPDDLKKVILANSGAETSAWLAKVFDDAAANARKAAQERGDAINVLPKEELAKWKPFAQAVIDEWIKGLDQRGVPGKELIEVAREAIAEYDPAK